jgi:hypoxanthine phosphoribosyltransferase
MLSKKYMNNMKKINNQDVPDLRNIPIIEKKYYLKNELVPEIKGILISSLDYESKIKQLGNQIRDKYKDKFPMFIYLLNGSAKLYGDFFGHLNHDEYFEHTQQYILAKSTDGIKTGKANYSSELDLVIKSMGDRYVIIFEDIVDSGGTLNGIFNKIKEQNVTYKELEIYSTTLKLDQLKPENKYLLEYLNVGFIVPNLWIVGRGLDLENKFRKLPDICVLNDETIKKHTTN